MITGEIRSKIDAVWNAFWSGGIANPLESYRADHLLARERALVREYLNRYLPRNLLVRQNGEVVATDGSCSGECDVLVCDPSTPPLWTVQDVEVVPVECLHAVIEVKSQLDVPTLRASWEKLSAIKRFPKTAFLPSQSPIRRVIELYGQQWPYFPTLAFVFAYESVALEGIADAMWELADGTAPEHRIDAVWVLNRGSVLWLNEDGSWQVPAPGKISVQILENLSTTTPLPLMTMQLQGLMQTAFSPPFRIGDYMGYMPLGVRKNANPSDAEDEQVN